MPKIENSIAGEWEFLDSTITTGDSWNYFNEMYIMGEIYQDISRPYEVGVFNITNTANIVNQLPIVSGTEIKFNYSMNGHRFQRAFTVVDVGLSGDDVNKLAQLVCVSTEYYKANLDKNCLYFNEKDSKQMLDIIARRGETEFEWFQVDTTEPEYAIIPSGMEPVDFVNDVIRYSLTSGGKQMRSWLMKSKEGYSIASPESFTEKFNNYWRIGEVKTLANRSPDFGRNTTESAKEEVKTNEFFRIHSYAPLDMRSSENRREYKEFSNVNEFIDPFRKVYEEYKYEKNKTVSGYTFNLLADEKKDADRVLTTVNTARYEEVTPSKHFKEYELNRRGFSLQDTISVVVWSSIYMEVGNTFFVDIASDIAGAKNAEYISDPVYSGERFVIETKQVFAKNELARTTLTLASRGEAFDANRLYKNSKLGK